MGHGHPDEEGEFTRLGVRDFHELSADTSLQTEAPEKLSPPKIYIGMAAWPIRIMNYHMLGLPGGARETSMEGRGKGDDHGPSLMRTEGMGSNKIGYSILVATEDDGKISPVAHFSSL